MSAAVAEIPVDQADRDRVRTADDVSIFVEAGAGTGKTRAIVDRVVAMVAVGRLQLRELAAITFTEAAASELRDRIRTALERGASGDDPLIFDPAARELCAEALDQVDETALTTLHGFAQRILAEHPLEAGLPPAFEVLDEIRARVEFEQRWAAFVDDLFDDEALAPALLRGLALGLSPALLHGVACAAFRRTTTCFRTPRQKSQAQRSTRARRAPHSTTCSRSERTARTIKTSSRPTSMERQRSCARLWTASRTSSISSTCFAWPRSSEQGSGKQSAGASTSTTSARQQQRSTRRSPAW